MSEKLKPCPFCGFCPEECDSHSFTGVSSHEPDLYYIACWNDYCLVQPQTSMFYTEAKAIKAWNKRI